MSQGPIVIRIQGPGWEAVVEVDRALYKDAAGVARRLRMKGLAALQRLGEVLVNPNAYSG